MANMSYCRFENTNGDLKDCLEVMHEADEFGDLDLNVYEQEAFRDMYANCKQFVAEFRRLAAEFLDEGDDDGDN